MKILFIGNSHTYMNDMPELARQMMEDVTGQPCEVTMLAYSGRPLKWHMEEEYFSVRFNILYGGYDYCIIQEQAHPMTFESDTDEYTKRIIGLCRKAGTRPVIFETWAEKVKPENQAEMNRRYRRIAKDHEALLAPIGEVWEKFMKASDADLYFRDGEHASPVGDHLTALVIVHTITGRIPEKSFRKALDFTRDDDKWLPVKENGEDEMMELPEEITDLMHDLVS